MNILFEKFPRGCHWIAKAPIQWGVGGFCKASEKVAGVANSVFKKVSDRTWDGENSWVLEGSALVIGGYCFIKGYHLWSGAKSGFNRSSMSKSRVMKTALEIRKDWWKGVAFMIFGVGTVVGSGYSLLSGKPIEGEQLG